MYYSKKQCSSFIEDEYPCPAGVCKEMRILSLISHDLHLRNDFLF